MEVITKMPVTLSERLEYGEEMIIPATFDEFLDMLEECEYRIEYDNGEIISYMGYATKLHEKLVASILRLIGNLLNLDEYSVYGSNLALHIPGFNKRHYNADCAIVKGEEEEVILRGNMTAVANPVLIVEVLSGSTKDFDLGRKFRNYTKIPSLQQIMYIESTEMKVYNYFRNGDNEWRYREFSEASDSLPVLQEGYLTLEEIYRHIKLEE